MRWEEGRAGPGLWPRANRAASPTLPPPHSGSEGGLFDLCHGCIVGGGGELCLAVGTSQISWQPNIPWILTLGTAIWAMQTTLSLGRESLELGVDQHSPAPFPSRPGQGLSLARLRAACPPIVADCQHLPCFTGQGGWWRASARLMSAAARLGKGEGSVSREACSLMG